MTIQIAVEAAMAVKLALSPDHGEIIVRPKPEPSSISTAVVTTAAKAPAKIGPQVIAGLDASPASGGATLRGVI